MNDSIETTATYREITTQTVAWREAIDMVAGQADALRARWSQGRYDSVMFTGCGSTYYLSLAGAALWQTLMDAPAKAMPGGELYLYPRASYGSLAGRPPINTRYWMIGRYPSSSLSASIGKGV